MVKGISRRVVIVKSPDPRIFEEAIFIVREDYLNSGGQGSDELIKEAQRVADMYARTEAPGGSGITSRFPAPLFAAAGAAATGIAWLAIRLIGI